MALLGRRVRATQEGSREVDCVPSETDGVGVETHQVALANDPFAGFPEVGEGVRSGLEQAGRDELAAAGDERSVELGPDLGFGAARCDGCVHVTDARLDAAHCFADDPELGRDLDLATRLEHWPRVDQLDATLAQGVGDEEVQPLDPQPGTRPARTSDVGGDLAGEGRDRLEITGTRGGEMPGARRISSTVGRPAARCSLPANSNNTTGPAIGTSRKRLGPISPKTVMFRAPQPYMMFTGSEVSTASIRWSAITIRSRASRAGSRSTSCSTVVGDLTSPASSRCAPEPTSVAPRIGGRSRRTRDRAPRRRRLVRRRRTRHAPREVGTRPSRAGGDA